MPLRKAAAKPSSRQQTILSFKTPSKIIKNQSLHPGIKKDVISVSTKRETTSQSPPAQEVARPEPIAQPQTEEERVAISLDVDDIKEYYKASVLGPRHVLPVHQEDLTLDEKVLRYFDMSTQYGPCIGMSRIDRWRRAKRMGLNPPVEVLSVCLKIERELGRDKGVEGVDLMGVRVDRRRDTRRAFLDDALSTRMAREYVGVV